MLQQLTSSGKCVVETKPTDAISIMDGVKKEKVRWVKSGAWPKGKALKIDQEFVGDKFQIIFRMVTDTSIRNL